MESIKNWFNDIKTAVIAGYSEYKALRSRRSFRECVNFITGSVDEDNTTSENISEGVGKDSFIYYKQDRRTKHLFYKESGELVGV